MPLLRGIFYSRYSKISLGWQSKALHMASNVEKHTAFVLEDF